MDAVPPHILQHRVPEPAMDCAYLVLFFIFNYFRGIHHRGHGATPSRRIRFLRMGFIGSYERIGTRVPQVQCVLFMEPSKKHHAPGNTSTAGMPRARTRRSLQPDANTPDPPAVFGKLRRKTPPKNFPRVFGASGGSGGTDDLFARYEVV